MIKSQRDSVYLPHLGLIDVLQSLYGRVMVPRAVVAELAEGARRGIAVPDPPGLSWVSVESVRGTALIQLVADLGAGEREVMALATQRPGALVILDDARARRHARLLRLRLTGTLGVLLRAKERGKVAALTPWIERLVTLGFHLDDATRVSLLRLAGGQP